MHYGQLENREWSTGMKSLRIEGSPLLLAVLIRFFFSLILGDSSSAGIFDDFQKFSAKSRSSNVSNGFTYQTDFCA